MRGNTTTTVIYNTNRTSEGTLIADQWDNIKITTDYAKHQYEILRCFTKTTHIYTKSNTTTDGTLL